MNHVEKKDFWEYDPVANTWAQKADFGGSERYAAVGFSMGSNGYIGTGVYGIFSSLSYYKDFWEYNPDANTWIQKADFGGLERYAAVGFSIGSKGYIGTGFGYGGTSDDFWEYDPVTNTWAQKVNFGGTARDFAVGFSIGNKGYIGTGWDGSYKKDFWEYDSGAFFLYATFTGQVSGSGTALPGTSLIIRTRQTWQPQVPPSMPPSQAHGVWQWNGTTWNQLNYQDPANMAAAGSSLYATFTGARCLAVEWHYLEPA